MAKPTSLTKAASVPSPPRFTFLDDAGAETTWSADPGVIHAIARGLPADLAPGAAIGLLFRSGPALVETWFAALAAGLRPLIVQYPTRKQSRAYWFDSVSSTVTRADLAAIIADAYCVGIGLPHGVRVIAAADLPRTPVADPGPLLPEQFSILQLSSGTTGHRKAMEFTSAALARHAADFNDVLKLDPSRDRIVSWLPLYHDMGYVACFVMPILLGIDVVMMDPVTWVQTPALLFDAIARHAGTICYMPNFGFEVMTRAPARELASMRHWISCSEPVSATTAQKFCAHIGADPSTFAPCYAMAENLFAVTLGTGYDTRVIEGADVVSCGRTIPGVQIRIVAGEIWVRSPTSLAHYLGGEDIRDADGYYPTGDMGALLDGELYVSGRKGDVLIQAGRKFMLSDVDLKLNEAYPEIRGRAATLAVHDARLGTETPLVLIEALDFFDRTDMAQIAARMIDETGMDQLEVAYVPPRFLTKTSSGKINRRKTRDDWLAVQSAKHRTAGPRDAVAELRTAFGHIDWNQPIRDVLDSLSSTVIKITLESTPVAFDPARTLNELANALSAAATRSSTSDVIEGIRIVSLADRRVVTHITRADLDSMAAVLGCPVTLEHVCLPPAPILLSDLVFHDWFEPRLDPEPFGNIDHAMSRLKGASVILVDDVAQMGFLSGATYPVLSHNLERHEKADLLCFRWQNYTKQHHKLPVSFVCGRDLAPSSVANGLAQLQRYLKTPFFRVAAVKEFAEQCDGWEHRVDNARSKTEQSTDMWQALTHWLSARPDLRRSAVLSGTEPAVSDLAHFCSALVRREALERVVNSFDSFYVGGEAASLPYLRKTLDALGKPYTLLPSVAASAIDAVPDKHECVALCGAWGEPPPGLPAVAFQHIGKGWRFKNMGAATAKLEGIESLNEILPSAADWYCNVEVEQRLVDKLVAANTRARAARLAAAAAG